MTDIKHNQKKSSLVRTLQNSLNLNQGFTIVELLIVVVVIAILAAVTIVGYNGVSRSAVEATMKSDLESSAKTLEADNIRNSAYPTTINSANNGQGLKPSGNSQFAYRTTPTGYCVSITNPKTSAIFNISSTTGKISDGICEAVVGTFAGSGVQGSTNGTGTAAQFSNPEGVAVDSTGTVYVADTGNSRIRKISPAGVVTSFAGADTGLQGSADGTGTAARFYLPKGIAVDSTGTVYVGDSVNHLIRKISPAGVVTTLAGSGTQGFADGTGAAAQFYFPEGVAVDNTGTVYVADSGNHRIRKISPAGVVTTLAGSNNAGFDDGTGAAAQFYRPYGVAVDSSGTVYVADSVCIRKISPSGVVTTLAGSNAYSFADGTGAAAMFDTLYDIAIDSSGTLYAADGVNNRIRKISQSGVVTTLAGSSTQGFADGMGSAAQFRQPHGVAVDSSTGTVYVADYYNHRIRKIN